MTDAAPPARDTTGPRAGRRPPAAVWALVGLQLLLGLVWSLVAPIYRAPDETQHTDLVLALARGEPYPDAYGRQVGSVVTASSVLANLSRDGTPLPDRDLRFDAELAPPRSARPAFAALEPDEPTEHGNQMPQHPPLYYRLAAAVLGVLPDGLAFDLQVWVLRAAGALLVAPLPLLAWSVAARLTPDGLAALAAAALPVAVPQLAHVAGSVSNDGLLTLAVGCLLVALAAVLSGDLRVRTALAAAGALGLALLTKGFALAIPPAVAAAYAVAAWRLRRGGGAPRAALLPAGVALGGAAALGGWWYVRNLVRYGTLQPEAFPWPDLPAEPVTDFGYWVPYALSRVVLRFWGQVGWVEVALPWPVVWALAGALAVGVAAGLLARRAPLRRADAAVLLLPLAGTAAVVLLGAVAIYVRTGIPAGVQGRYLFPALAGMAAVAGAGGVALLGRAGRWLPAAVVLGGLATHGLAVVLALQHWYGPAPVEGLLAWSPLPPPAVAAVAGAALLAAAAALALLGRAGTAFALRRDAATLPR